MVPFCGKCGYEIAGLPDSPSLCPECGERIGRSAAPLNPSFRLTFVPVVAPTGAIAAASVAFALAWSHMASEAMGGYVGLVGLLIALIVGAGLPPVIAINRTLHSDLRGRKLHPMEAVFFCAIGWAGNFGILWLSSAVAARFVRIPGIC